MNTNIVISLEERLQAFLMHEFKTENGVIILNTQNELGKYIISMISISDLPPDYSKVENSCTICLPTRNWNSWQLSEGFPIVTPWKQKLIQLYLTSEFYLRIKEFFFAGHQRGYRLDAIINAFLNAYDLKNNSINSEMVKKLDYRHRRKLASEMSKEIQLYLEKRDNNPISIEENENGNSYGTLF